MNGAVREFLCVDLGAGGGADDLIACVDDIEDFLRILRDILERMWIKTAG